jgi:hypothetical protein
MATAVNEAEKLREEMRQVRTELKADVEEIVAGARVLTDWKHYVRQYPWICVGAAAAAGFFIVPSKPVVVKPSQKDLIELAKEHKLFVDTKPQPMKKPGLVGSLAGMAAGAIAQGAMALASHHLDQFLKGLTERPPPDQRPGQSPRVFRQE